MSDTSWIKKLPVGSVKLGDLELIFILETLRHTNGNRTKAAGLLGIGYRTLTNKIQRLRLLNMDVPSHLNEEK